MGTKSPGGPQRCRLILQHCLAIQLSKPGHTPEDFWMYDSGYMIFQNFLAANAQCWWNAPLTAATRALKYAGHVAPGMLLVSAEPCALEVLRGAYARSVLKPPATYVISSVGDIDDCIVTPTVQGQFTPLPEALCDVIMDLTAEGHSATIENIRIKLGLRFPHMTPPATEVIYDTLAQLMQEQKIYQTAKGYFIFTPERRRSRSRPRNPMRTTYQEFEEHEELPLEARTMLMTNAEALHSLYGEISTERDGDLTHQCIQTNLADVICGGNPNDKIMYPRAAKRRSASFPTPRSLERRHSLRIFGSSKRLQRCASTRSLSKTYAQTLATDSSSSEYQSTDSSSPKKGSLLSRLFRRSGRTKQRQIETYSAQFPPAEWFNSRAVHLHSVGTQTADHDLPVTHTLSNSTFYDGSELSQRSSTLPRRHRRHMSSESTFLISSRDCSPIRRRSPVYCSSSLPRSTQSIPAGSGATSAAHSMTTTGSGGPTANGKMTHHSSATLSRLTSNSSKSPAKSVIGKHIFDSHGGSGRQTSTKRQTDSNVIVNGYATADGKQHHHHNNHNQNHSQNYNHNQNHHNQNHNQSHHNQNLNQNHSQNYNHTQNHHQQQHNHQLQYRSIGQSGPSSIESGKASSMMTSGPSSIDSGKVSFSKTSGHSSLDSQCSTNTAIGGGGTGQPTSSGSTTPSTRSILVLNGSPRGSPRHQALRARAAEQQTQRLQRCATPSRILEEITNHQAPPPTSRCPSSSSSTTTGNMAVPQSTSNNSITLQVTTSGSGCGPTSIPSTKIFVQNSPVRSVITLENGKLTDNSNVFIINNETTTNEKGEIIKKTLSRQQTTPLKSAQQQQQQLYKANSLSENDANSETCDSISFISETSPDPLDTTTTTTVYSSTNEDSSLLQPPPPPDTNGIFSKFSKTGMNNDSSAAAGDCTMNNSRKLCLQLPSPAGTHIVYKNNVLRNDTSGAAHPLSPGTTHQRPSADPYDAMGSVGNLRFYEKNSLAPSNEKLMNSNCDLKNLRYESVGNLQKIGCGPTAQATHINGGDLAHLLQKSMIAMGSEPNLLTLKDNNCSSALDKSVEKEAVDRRLSLSKDISIGGSGSAEQGTSMGSLSGNVSGSTNGSSGGGGGGEELYNFPSLTDLSFNFTSLAAQKILQGVSLNSIDTLVELNMAAAAVAAKEKQQNNQPTPVCTDYGMV